jgi:predicted secreted protein
MATRPELTVEDLRRLCRQRNIDYRGLRKIDLERALFSVRGAGDGNAIAVASNTLFTVKLSCSPSVPDRWSFMSDAMHPDLFTLVCVNYVPDPQPPGWVGGGGTEEWVFRAGKLARGNMRQTGQLRMWNLPLSNNGAIGKPYKTWNIVIASPSHCQ